MMRCFDISRDDGAARQMPPPLPYACRRVFTAANASRVPPCAYVIFARRATLLICPRYGAAAVTPRRA